MSIFHTITYRMTSEGAGEMYATRNLSDFNCQAIRGGSATPVTRSFVDQRAVTRFHLRHTKKLFRFMTAAGGH
jgi:hypothetical protein